MLERSQLPRFICLLIGSILFLYGLYIALGVTGQSVAAMIAQGWGRYLGMDNDAPGIFIIACFSDGECRAPFYQLWGQRYSWWIPIAATLTLVASTILMFISDGMPSGSEKAPGGARWASDKELLPLRKEDKGKFSSPLRGYIGHTKSGKLLRVPENKRNAHTLIVGGPGSGKTTRYFKQNLLMDALDGTSCVVLDLKYPDARGGFFNMVPFFEKQGYDVQLFLPYSEKTLNLPLLAGADTFDGASEFARMIVPIDTDAGDAEFYKNQERKLLTGLVWGLTLLGETSLGQLYKMLMMGKGAVRGFIESHPDKDIKEMFTSFLEIDDAKLAGIVNGLEGKLQIFRDDRLERSTKQSAYPWENVDLTSLGTKKSILYIGVPQENLLSGDGQLLLQLTKRVLDRALLRNAREHGGTLPVDTSFYLDEFPSLGELPNMEENFATMRSYRVGYHVALQNRAQLESVYGKAAANSLLTNLFQHILVFPRYLKFDDAKFFAEALGEMTVIETTRNRMNSMEILESFKRGASKKEGSRPLLSMEEMFDWPDAVGVVIANGMPPIKTVMPRLDQAKVHGKQNKLQHYHAKLPDNVDVADATSALLQGRRTAMMARSAAEGNLKDLIQTKRNSGSQVAAMTKGKVVGAGDKDAFTSWIDAVLNARAKVTLYTENETGKVTKIAVDAGTLPGELAEPDALKVWVKQRWVKKQKEQLGIVSDGMALLGAERIAQFVALDKAQASKGAQRQAKSSAQPSKPKERSRPAQTRSTPKSPKSQPVSTTKLEPQTLETAQNETPRKRPASQPPKDEGQGLFLAWVDALLSVQPQPAVLVYTNTETDEVTKITVHTSTLPAELAEPAALSSWVKARFIKKQKDKLGLVSEGIAQLGQRRTERFAALAALQQTAADTAKAKGESEGTRASKDTSSAKPVQVQKSEEKIGGEKAGEETRNVPRPRARAARPERRRVEAAS